ncbi:flagellar basal body rod protein FlgF [Paraferrimonas sp. SM1919]|uniref:flagellar basal body rod protein FlgF n=1 Tax=Paraferrimonas sp. SM1919 TaxID=2662263 RepID=UPI0013D7ACA3|nr:flagellar basal body rod protein FlgF [Paraferrimonas sp. SM1919]
MDKLMYTAVSGATRAMQGQQVHAHNLANGDSMGFKAQFERSEAHRLEGTGYQARVLNHAVAAGTSFAHGELEVTGRELDIAVSGDGYFAVAEGEQERYVRTGQLRINGDNQLVLGNRPVMGINGAIEIPENRRITIGANGMINMEPQDGGLSVQLDTIKLVNPANNQLTKTLDGLYKTIDDQPLDVNDEVSLVTGHLEGSNVNPVAEMIANMNMSRQFEMQIKMMKAADSLAQAGNRLIRGS